MVRAAWLVILSFASLSNLGCSLLLDLPADCTEDDCGGFRCNEERTGCLANCKLDIDCSDGFVCDDSVCLATGCVPDGEPVEFTPAQSTADVDFDFNGEEIAAIWVDPDGLFFQRFDERGAPKAQPLRLDDAEAAPGRPALTWTGALWGLAWEGTELNEDGEPVEALRFAVVSPEDVFEVTTRTLWRTVEDRMTGQVEKSVDDAAIIWDEVAQRFILAWSTRVTSSDIYMMVLNLDGTGPEGEIEIPHELGRKITFSGEDSVQPRLARRGDDVYDVAFREGAGTVNVILRTVSGAGNRQGDDLDTSSTSDRALTHDYTAITSGSIAVFAEQGAERGRVFRAQIRQDRSLARDTKFEIDRDFTTAREATVASAGEGEYAAFFVAERDGVADVYMARFKDNGARIGAPFSVTEGLAREPTSPVVVPSSNGYMILYGEGEGVNLRRWACSPAP